MPRALEKQLQAQAIKKGLAGDRKNAYVFGTLQKVMKKKKAKGYELGGIVDPAAAKRSAIAQSNAGTTEGKGYGSGKQYWGMTPQAAVRAKQIQRNPNTMDPFAITPAESNRFGKTYTPTSTKRAAIETSNAGTGVSYRRGSQYGSATAQARGYQKGGVVKAGPEIKQWKSPLLTKKQRLMKGMGM